MLNVSTLLTIYSNAFFDTIILSNPDSHTPHNHPDWPIQPAQAPNTIMDVRVSFHSVIIRVTMNHTCSTCLLYSQSTPTPFLTLLYSNPDSHTPHNHSDSPIKPAQEPNTIVDVRISFHSAIIRVTMIHTCSTCLLYSQSTPTPFLTLLYTQLTHTPQSP